MSIFSVWYPPSLQVTFKIMNRALCISFTSITTAFMRIFLTFQNKVFSLHFTKRVKLSPFYVLFISIFIEILYPLYNALAPKSLSLFSSQNRLEHFVCYNRPSDCFIPILFVQDKSYVILVHPFSNHTHYVHF